MVIRTLLVLVAATGFAVSAVHAEDPKEVAAEIAAARKAKDDAATSVAVKKSADAYRATEDKAAKSALLGELGKVLKDKKMTQARLAVVDSLVEIGDAKPCWKQMSKLMPNAKKTDKATDLQLAVVSAAGRLAVKSAIKPLTELAYKAKDNNLAAAAARAFGGYGKDKKNRLKILEELMNVGKRSRPGVSPGKTVSKEAQDRWGIVSSGVIDGLNRLTGNEIPTYEEWEEEYKKHKKKPANLFKE